jgi:phosphoglycolate phosphatase
MKNINTILFDLDGTLTDPKVGITTCIEYALSKLGVPYVGDSLDWCIGPPLIESFQILLNTTDTARLTQAIDFYRERFATIGMYENTIYPNVEHGLSQLKQQGFAIYLATSKPHVYANQILHHFGLDLFFNGVYGSELSGARNDKTALIAYILQQEAFDPRTAVMVGDRQHDVIGARNNGISTIAVSYGYGTQDELALINPNNQCQSFAAVVDLLLSRKPH